MGDQENGKKKGLAVLVEEAREQAKVLTEKVKTDIVEPLKKPQKTPLYKSIFRVKHDESERSRALGVLTNVFLHLHPAKLIATRSATATPGEWAGSPFICLSFSRSRACC